MEREAIGSFPGPLLPLSQPVLMQPLCMYFEKGELWRAGVKKVYYSFCQMLENVALISAEEKKKCKHVGKGKLIHGMGIFRTYYLH